MGIFSRLFQRGQDGQQVSGDADKSAPDEAEGGDVSSSAAEENVNGSPVLAAAVAGGAGSLAAPLWGWPQRHEPARDASPSPVVEATPPPQQESTVTPPADDPPASRRSALPSVPKPLSTSGGGGGGSSDEAATSANAASAAPATSNVSPTSATNAPPAVTAPAAAAPAGAKERPSRPSLSPAVSQSGKRRDDSTMIMSPPPPAQAPVTAPPPATKRDDSTMIMSPPPPVSAPSAPAKAAPSTPASPKAKASSSGGAPSGSGTSRNALIPASPAPKAEPAPAPAAAAPPAASAPIARATPAAPPEPVVRATPAAPPEPVAPSVAPSVAPLVAPPPPIPPPAASPVASSLSDALHALDTLGAESAADGSSTTVGEDGFPLTSPNIPMPIIGDEISESFNRVFFDLGGEPGMGGPAAGVSTASDLAAVRDVFNDIAVVHVSQVRDVMLELRFGDADPAWLESTKPALRSLRAMAEQMELVELCGALDHFCEAVVAAVANRARIGEEAKAELLSRYQKLSELIPQAFELDAERDRREPIIVEALLYQIDGVEKPVIDRLFGVGLNRLDALLRVNVEDLVAMAEVRREVAEAIVDQFRTYRATADAAVSTRDPSAERRSLGDLVIMLSILQDDFVRAADDWTDEARVRKRSLRKEREQTFQRIRVSLVRLGDRDQLSKLERLPFNERISALERYIANQPPGHA
jgi:hypothetical protein